MMRLRLPLRLARREVVRRPGRTALVALLVALPVAGMMTAAVFIRTDRPPPLEQYQRQYGQADAVFFDGPAKGFAFSEQPITTADLVEHLPEGARVVPVSSTYEKVRTVDGDRADLDVSDLPLSDPITVGIHDLVAGRAPATRGEVALGGQLATNLHASVGEDLVFDHPELTLRVVGLIEPVGCLSCSAALVAPGALDQFEDARASELVQLVDLPDRITAQHHARMDQIGQVLIQRDAMLYDDFSSGGDAATVGVFGSLVLGGLVLAVMGIVIAAAFSVGARRQLVTLGQLSASGVDPATVKWALVLQGTVTGAVGAVSGLIIAAAALGLGRGRVERMFDERISSYTVRPVDVLLVAAMGMGAATWAALAPARSAAAIPTLAALAGRRPFGPVSRRLLASGSVAVTAGLGLLALAVVGSQSGRNTQVWALAAILGGLAEMFGACALAPALVAQLEPLAARLHGSWRLGARSLARHRSRTGGVVSAIAAAGALAVLAGAVIQGVESGKALDLPPDVVIAPSTVFGEQTGMFGTEPGPPELRRDLLRILGEPEELTLWRSGVPLGTQPVGRWEARLEGTAGVKEPAGLRTDTGPEFYLDEINMLVADAGVLDVMRADQKVRDALATYGVVVLTRRQGDHPIEVQTPVGRKLEAVALSSRYGLSYTLSYQASLLVSPAMAKELGLLVEPVGTAFRADHRLTQQERDAIADLTFDMEQSGVYSPPLMVPSPTSGPSPFALQLILAGLALVFALFVISGSLALAAAESKDERDVLTIAGGPPGMLARSAGAKAWLMSSIGGAMAIPIGFLPVVVFSIADNSSELRLIFPTRTALVLVLLAPFVVALASWAASATSQRLRPVRVSTATFE